MQSNIQSPTAWHRRRVAGVPLGELLAVLCIAAVMAAILFPVFAKHPHRPLPTLAEQWQALPIPIAALQPRTVRNYGSLSSGRPRMLEIQFWSGSPRQPYYGLWVLSRSAPPGYEPKLSDFWQFTVDPSPFAMQKVADRVYEVFRRR